MGLTRALLYKIIAPLFFLHPLSPCSFSQHAGYVKVRRPVADGANIIEESPETQQPRGPCGITAESETEFVVRHAADETWCCGESGYRR